MRLHFVTAPLVALGLAVAMGAAGPAGPAAQAAEPGAEAAGPIPQIEHAPALAAIAGTSAADAAARRLEIGGHRGGVDRAPENTLAAVRTAVASGAHSVEVDVRYTADGTPVILHDDTLERTTNCTGYVADWKLSALLRCDAGTWFHQTFSDERVPTLAELLDELADSDLTVYLHVKLVDTVAQATALVGAVAVSDIASRRVVFVADEHERLETLALAGVPRERLAWVVHHKRDFAAHLPRWGTLVAHCPKLTRADVERIQARGQRVVAVEGYPITRARASELELDGFLADDLQAAIAYVD